MNLDEAKDILQEDIWKNGDSEDKIIIEDNMCRLREGCWYTAEYLEAIVVYMREMSE